MTAPATLAPNALPMTLEEVTPEWLSQAMGVSVRSARVVDVKNGTCTKVRIALETAPGSGIPETVILKAGFEPHSRALHYTHHHEVNGYARVAPVLGLHTPRCWFAEYDGELLQGVVIMEDLVARGVRFLDPLKPEGFESTKARLGALARFHAASWGSADLEPGGRFDFAPNPVKLIREHFLNYFSPEGWARFTALPRAVASSVRFLDRDWHMGAIAALDRLCDSLPHAVLHGDTHLGNLYEDIDGTPGFFDMQIFRCPPLLEVVYHMVCALDVADRAEWERPLLQHYLDTAAAAGAAVPSLEAAMEQYSALLIYAWTVFLFNDTTYQREEVNTAYTARIGAAMLAHDTMGTLARL